ncbi:MAG TPA: hypothetical protein VLX44_17125 [Xanthobacteraceae bacterium]|nr:hypothetical protein [Xanthobacteraceae bacterium]
MRIAIIVAFLLLPIAAQAQNLRAAASGVPLKLLFIASTNPDCSSYGRTTIQVVVPPQHGHVRITQGREFPTFTPSNPRSACNTRRVAGSVAYYVSQRGYRGPDAVILDGIYATGRLRRWTYGIVVR